jgi:hypothetical protein
MTPLNLPLNLPVKPYLELLPGSIDMNQLDGRSFNNVFQRVADNTIESVRYF